MSASSSDVTAFSPAPSGSGRSAKCVASEPATCETRAPSTHCSVSTACEPMAPKTPPPAARSDHQFHARCLSARASARYKNFA
jgi:hypothetical protein